MSVISLKGKKDVLGNTSELLYEKGIIYVGRHCFQGGWKLQSSSFHNPYSVKKYDIHTSLRMYTEHLYSAGLINNVPNLQGFTLACWCDSRKCHAVILDGIRSYYNYYRSLPTLEQSKSWVESQVINS